MSERDWTLHQGASERVLPTLPANSVDALVTDPPAGIAFMGKTWDSDKGGRDAWVRWMTGIMTEAFRVLKPGGHGLVWTLPRTSHWTAWALEDAGFEIRDSISHLFGSGFPKSLDVSKAIDKAAGAQREVVGQGPFAARRPANPAMGLTFADDAYIRPPGDPITAPATDAAKIWAGWGTALKPAREDWILVRKPLIGTVAANVLAHGTGAINIDGSRIDAVGRPAIQKTGEKSPGSSFDTAHSRSVGTTDVGRWPSHVILDEEAGALLDQQSGTLTSGALEPYRRANTAGYSGPMPAVSEFDRPGDSGGASRFFYTAKASSAERHARGHAKNEHATVKPLALMRYLVKLVTPPGGVVLDPFAGSGTTGIAAIQEGFRFIGIEQDEASVQTANDRAGLLAHL